MKYIFPRQFGLHNVFTSRVNFRETVQPFKDYTVREDEIEAANRTARMRKGLALNGADGDLGKVKLPKRLRGELVSLIQKLQKRHTRCAYTELLKYYCPAEVRNIPFPNSCLFAVSSGGKESLRERAAPSGEVEGALKCIRHILCY